MFSLASNFVKRLFQKTLKIESKEPKAALLPLSSEHRSFLNSRVAFFQKLDQEDKLLFEKRVFLFFDITKVIGHDVEVSDEDCLLIAAAAIMLVWKLPDWHYINLHTVYLVSSSFNENAELAKADSAIVGLVGNGDLYGKMILSQTALHQGFNIGNDKHNVAIHEFAHLIDMKDGNADGFPERLQRYSFAMPWLELVRQETLKIQQGQSDINDYASTNPVEFFAVTTEYFFEQPALLKRKHPEIYASLKKMYKNDLTAIQKTRDVRKKSPCPCNSGKRYKHCCAI